MCVTETLTLNAPHVDIDLDVLYPAGEPLPESRLHERLCREAMSVLEEFFSAASDVLVAANLNLYYREGARSAVVEPDIMVIAGIDTAQPEIAASYRTWQHGGTILFALEAASESTLDADGGHKRDLYASLGVAEYWRIDPTDGELLQPPVIGERLRDGHWEPIEVTTDAGGGLRRGHSTTLGLDLCWDPPKLRLYDPATGTWLLDHQDLAQARRDDIARADAEAAARRDAETAKQAAETRVTALEAELAELRERLGDALPGGTGRTVRSPGPGA